MAGDTRRTTLLALAQRAEAGGDETLSDDCWRALGWTDKGRRGIGRERFWRKPVTREPFFGDLPDLRISLDAQEALPGRIRSINKWPQGWVCEVFPEPSHARDPADSFVGRAPTEALARLAAKLRAMAEKESASGG